MRSLMIIPYLLLNCCQSHNLEMCQIKVTCYAEAVFPLIQCLYMFWCV